MIFLHTLIIQFKVDMNNGCIRFYNDEKNDRDCDVIEVECVLLNGKGFLAFFKQVIT